MALYPAFVADVAGFVLPVTLACADTQGHQVVHGQATLQSNCKTLTVTNTPGSAINWPSFWHREAGMVDGVVGRALKQVPGVTLSLASQHIILPVVQLFNEHSSQAFSLEDFGAAGNARGVSSGALSVSTMAETTRSLALSGTNLNVHADVSGASSAALAGHDIWLMNGTGNSACGAPGQAGREDA